MPVGYYGYFAWVRHEHFHRGYPTSHWGRAIKHWKPDSPPPPSSIPYLDSFLTYLGFRGEAAVLSGEEEAVPVLLDLIWNLDDEISSPAAHVLTLTRLPTTFRGDWPGWGEDHAERAEGRIVILARDRFVPVPGSDSRRLVLLNDKGQFLDIIECAINSRLTYGRVHRGTFHLERCTGREQDGAQFVFRYLPPAGEAISGHHPHSVVHGEHSQLFYWDQSNPTNIRSAEWKEKGLCRVAVRNDAFEVLWPPPSAAKEPSSP